MLTRMEAIAQLTAPGEPFELVLEELYGRPCRTFKNAPPTFRELFEDSLRLSSTISRKFGGAFLKVRPGRP